MKAYYINLLLVSVLLLCGLYVMVQNGQLSDYTSRITDLQNLLLQTESKLTEAESRTYALGENLWNKKHTYDVKFVIANNGSPSEFYAHKHILVANSPYFDVYFSRNTDTEIGYADVTKEEFNLVMEMLYFGKFKTSPKLASLPMVTKYLDTYMILSKYATQTEAAFASTFDGKTSSDEHNDVSLMANAYDIALTHNFVDLKTAILRNIYANWKDQGLFNKEHLIAHSSLFYDYIRFLNCDTSYSFT